VPPGFEDFSHHPGFKNCPGQRAGFEGGRAAPLGEVGGQTGIQKIELGCLHHAFGKIVVVRLQQPDHPRGLQNREPMAGSIGRDADIARHVGQIEQLRSTGCGTAQEAGKGAQVAHLSQITHVALQIGLQVRGVEQVAIHGFAGIQVRKAAAPDVAENPFQRRVPGGRRAGRWVR